MLAIAVVAVPLASCASGSSIGPSIAAASAPIVLADFSSLVGTTTLFAPDQFAPTDDHVIFLASCEGHWATITRRGDQLIVEVRDLSCFGLRVTRWDMTRQ